jgi:neutral amino acid transport system substrate-binding protein
MPTRQQIRDHIERVSQPPGAVVQWNELGKGLSLLREGSEINYQGASGAVDLASSGAIDSRIALFRFWEIRGDQIESTEYGSCVWNLR